MTIPDYQTIMKPLLESLSDKNEHYIRDTIHDLSKKFCLTDEERNQLLPSGTQAIFDNRVHWARQYLKKAGLIDAPKRAYIKITQRGINVLNDNPPSIDNIYLSKFDSFNKFKDGKHTKIDTNDEDIQIEKNSEIQEFNFQTPDEVIDESYQLLRNNLIQELLEKVKAQSSYFFEKLVIDLLLMMGYGGSRSDAGKMTKRSNDEGIDGTIFEDRLGLDIIYIQAKKWDTNVVSRPEIQKFVGALQGQKAKKGIFITTSTFSKSAMEYVSIIDSKVVLIDGLKLCEYMIDFNVGVQTYKQFEIKKLDNDYFETE
jgi:restriction system protein